MKAMRYLSEIKPFLFPALALLPFTPINSLAGTTTIFAPGVTQNSGWYDVNKKSTEQSPQKDFTYCWAATASNLIRWWQDGYVASGKTLPSGVPDGKVSALGYSCGIFDIFLDDKNWNSVVDGSSRGADVHVALKWYFNGESHTFSNYAKPLSGTGGYWKDEYSSLQNSLGSDFIQGEIGGYSTWGPYATDQSKSSIEIFSENLRNLLKCGAAGMSANTSLYGGHAITLWGADFDALGIVTAVYVTDSDDAATIEGPALRKYNVTSDNTSNVRRVYLDGTDYGTNQITALYGLTAYPIPEPSSFGLLAGLFSAALLCSRRKLVRRKA